MHRARRASASDGINAAIAAEFGSLSIGKEVRPHSVPDRGTRKLRVRARILRCPTAIPGANPRSLNLTCEEQFILLGPPAASELGFWQPTGGEAGTSPRPCRSTTPIDVRRGQRARKQRCGARMIVTGSHAHERLDARKGDHWTHLVLVRCLLVAGPQTPLHLSDIYLEDCEFVYDGMGVSGSEWISFVGRENRGRDAPLRS